MKTRTFLFNLFCAVVLSSVSNMYGQVPIGSGSYTTTYLGADSAGRNSFPSGIPKLSGSNIGKPLPTNDRWSKLVNLDFELVSVLAWGHV